jgi:hypothetical protein
MSVTRVLARVGRMRAKRLTPASPNLHMAEYRLAQGGAARCRWADKNVWICRCMSTV